MPSVALLLFLLTSFLNRVVFPAWVSETVKFGGALGVKSSQTRNELKADNDRMPSFCLFAIYSVRKGSEGPGLYYLAALLFLFA